MQFGRAQVESQRVAIRVRIHEKSPWWVPDFVDQEIFDKLMGEIEHMLDSIAADPEHPARAELIARVKSLQHSLADGSRARRQEPRLAAGARRAPRGARLRSRPMGPARRFLARGARGRAVAVAARRGERDPQARRVLRDDPEVAARLNGWLRQLLLYIVENYRDPLSEIVSETIERWDPIATSRRIELHIGTDLQYIRVNGTLVGGLVGLLIYLGARALG